MDGGYCKRIQTVSGDLSVTGTYGEAEFCHIFLETLVISVHLTVKHKETLTHMVRLHQMTGDLCLYMF